MEETVFNGNSEASHSMNHSNACHQDGRDSQVEESHEPVHHSPLTADAHITPEHLSQAPCTEIVEVNDIAALQLANSPDNTNDASEHLTSASQKVNSNDCTQLDVEQHMGNDNENLQEANERKDVVGTCAADDYETKLSMNQVQKKFDAFHQLDRPANVVIDLRSPPLVQLCLFHDANGDGAGSSGTVVGSLFPRRPQTARRGRRRPSSVLDRPVGDHKLLHKTAPAVLSDTDVPSAGLSVGSDGTGHCSKDERSVETVSTIIRLKVVDTPSEPVKSGTSSNFGYGTLLAGNPEAALPILPQRSDGSCSPESSDDNTMRVRNVNRTYTRNPVPAAQRSPQLTAVTMLTCRQKGTDVSCNLDKTTVSHHSQGVKSVPKKSNKAGKRRPRIGPAWFSRRFLSSPPPEIFKCARTSKTLRTLQRQNYSSGLRRRPIVARPATVKQVFEVPVVEEADIDTIGREQMRLWRLSEEDMDELRSQLRHEAEHRRTEHIMPLVMQMTDDQIEHAYERVTESMKTYEIVEPDSDEEILEADESEEEAVNDYKTNEYENSSQLEYADWYNYGTEGLAETEYARERPKRHAVDYGPCAFTPIRIMEGRRIFSERRKSSKESMLKSADRAERARVQRRSHRRTRKRKKSSATEQPDEASVKLPVGNSNDDDAAGRRVGLFDGLSQHHHDPSASSIQVDAETGSVELSKTLPLLIPAKHLAVISAVRSSPPPDLGQPMAPADVGAVAAPDGPPVLEPELDHAAWSSSDAPADLVPANVETNVAVCSVQTLSKLGVSSSK